MNPPDAPSVYLVRLVPRQAAAYRELMLEAYAAHPEAFTSSVAERTALPLAWWEARLAGGESPDEIVFGATDGAILLGVAGLSVEKREKQRHKATLFGMYVRDAWRGRGLGRRLVDAVLTHARARPSLRIVQLTVSAGNSEAEALYRRSGFVPFGSEPYAIAVGRRFVAKTHMWLDLAAAPLVLRSPQPDDFAVIAGWIPDADACLRWAGPRLAYPFAPDELSALLAHSNGESFCLAEADGEPRGFGQYWVVEAGAVHLGRIIVAPDSRGRGLGRVLCRQLIARALLATGAHSVTLRVFRDNAVAFALYASLGFAPVESKSDEQVLFMALPA